MNKFLKILLISSGVLFVGNLLFLDWWVLLGEGGRWDVGRVVRVRSKGEDKARVKEEEKIATGSCELNCQGLIEEKIKEELSLLPLPAGQSSVSPMVAKVTQPINGKPKVVYFKLVYIPLITSGSVTSISWTEIVPSEFYFDLSNYPNAKEVRFETYLLSLNNDLVMARLYDVTNKRGVDFSDLQTTSSTFTRVESTSLTIWRGNNKYTIQLRSVNGTQAQLKDARLKVLY